MIEPDRILILGVPRSGTTLLRRILNAHPVLACPAETNLFVSGAKFLKSDDGPLEVNIGLIPGLAYAGFDEEGVLARLRNFLFEFLDEFAITRQRSAWVEKTAFNAFYIREIERICGNNVKYICLLRHGLDVACSIEELCKVNGGYLSEIHCYVQRYPAPLEAFCWLWVDLTSEMLRLHRGRPESVLLVKYEDLVTASSTVLERISRFLGIPWHDDLARKALLDDDSVGLGDWKTYSKNCITTESVGRWQRMSQVALQRTAAIVNPTLLDCGYEAVDTGRAIDKDHRTHLGLMLQQLKKPDEKRTP